MEALYNEKSFNPNGKGESIQNIFDKEKYEGKCLIDRDMTKWEIEEIK